MKRGATAVCVLAAALLAAAGWGQAPPGYKIEIKALLTYEGSIPGVDNKFPMESGMLGDRAYHVETVGGGRALVIDGKSGPVFDTVLDGGVLGLGDIVAYLASKGGKRCAVVNGQAGPFYDDIVVGSLCGSPDGKRLAYTAKKGKKWRVVDGGKEGPLYDEIVDQTPAFSADGKRLAYLARSGDKWFAVLDGQAGPACDEILQGESLWTGPEFNQTLKDRNHLVYAALHGKQWSVVVDGKAGPVFEALQFGQETLFDMDPPTGESDCIGVTTGAHVSLDGSRVAYVARPSAAPEAKCFLVVDDKPGKEYDEIAVAGIVFGPDSKHLAYAARQGKEWRVVLDGKEGPAYDALGNDAAKLPGLYGPLFSLKGNRLAYAAKKDGKWLMVVDGEAGPAYDAIGSEAQVFPECYGLRFSPDGKHVAYTARKGETWRVVADGKPGAEYDNVRGETLHYSPDSAALAYVAEKDGRRVLVVNGQESPPYEEIELLGDPARGFSLFSPDGKRTAYTVKSGEKWLVAVDGKLGKEAYDVIGFIVFSPDSRHVAYEGRTEQLRSVVVDGVAGPVYAECGRPRFDPDGHITYWGNEGNPRYTRYQVRLIPDSPK
jgi:hypothetical protein